MSDINELIQKKLDDLPHNIKELAMEAIKSSEKGLPEATIVAHLANVVRKLVRSREEGE